MSKKSILGTDDQGLILECLAQNSRKNEFWEKWTFPQRGSGESPLHFLLNCLIRKKLLRKRGHAWEKCREDARGVAGVASATPKFGFLVCKLGSEI